MKILLGLIGIVLAMLAAKLYHLQIVRGGNYRVQAEEAMRSRELLAMQRGKITDRQGRILAIDEPCFDFCLDYRFLKSDPAWAAEQKRMLAVEVAQREPVDRRAAKAMVEQLYQQRAAATWAMADELTARQETKLHEQIARVMARVSEIRRLVNARRVQEVAVREERAFHAIVPGLDTDAAVKIQQRMEGLIGAAIRPSHKRVYHYGRHGCHMIGLTGEVSREEMSRHNLNEDHSWSERMLANYLPGDVVGKTGVEKMSEAYLRGQRGVRTFRLTGETLSEVPPVQGADVHLTLDIAMQKEAEALLERRGMTGSIVVLTVGTGESPECDVLAMASVPTFDLNRYRKDFAKLAADEINLPLLHRSVVQRYQPGSTVKPLAALGALGANVIGPGGEIDCRGYLHDPGSFRCWIWEQFRATHGPQDVREALKHSCNVYFYEVGDRLGWKRLGDWYSMFGFNAVPGTGLPDEKAGTVPDEKWLQDRYRRTFRRGDARLMAVGQGLLTVTPLHVANAMATIARDGVLLTPRVALEGAPKQVRHDLPLDPRHVQAVREGMYQVVNESGGTAYKYFHGAGGADLGGIELCGKTGTATTSPQRIDTDEDGRITRNDQVVRVGDTGWFVGFAPYRSPQVAFAVCVEYVEGGGGKNAAPIAADLVRLCQEMGYIRN
jgi:penicillin-binding protein 2